MLYLYLGKNAVLQFKKSYSQRLTLSRLGYFCLIYAVDSTPPWYRI